MQEHECSMRRNIEERHEQMKEWHAVEQEQESKGKGKSKAEMEVWQAQLQQQKEQLCWIY